MDRRVALVAVWAVFAAAAVGVGFGAAGLVGDPFDDRLDTIDSGVSVGRGSGGPSSRPETASTPGTPQPSPSTTSSPGPTRSAGPRGTPTSGPTRSTEPTAEGTSRTLSTRAGVVSARCRGALVRLAASPSIGWQLESFDDGDREARVRFEHAGEDGDRVEVRATCVGGRPRFAVEDDDDRSDEPSEEPSDEPSGEPSEDHSDESSDDSGSSGS